MGLEAGYSYISIDGYSLGINPTEYKDPRADKMAIPIKTLTKTVTQHWPIDSTDKTVWMKWSCLGKTQLDTLITKYNADYTSYVYIDFYGTSYNVVITNLIWSRVGMLDSEGFEVEMELQVC